VRLVRSWFPLIFQVSAPIPLELLTKLATIGVILIVTWIISRVLGGFMSRAVGKFSQNVARQVRRIATWLIWLIGILVGLDQLGLELTILLVIVTLGGIALLIAIRDMLSNAASHEVVTTYSPFKIGDWIQVGECFGRVVDITWMNTILVTPDNETVYIPNSKITKSIVINKTTLGGTRICVPLKMDEAQDLSEVEKILLEIGTELREELVPDSTPEVRVINLDDHAFELGLFLKINNPAKGKFIASEVRKRAKKRLDEIRRKTLK